MKFLTLGVTYCFSMLLFTGAQTSLADSPGGGGKVTVVPSLMGLDFKSVNFTPAITVLIPRTTSGNSSLQTRAYEKLRLAGLVPKEFRPRAAGAEADSAPTLTLTLSSELSDECPGKVRYTAKLELDEKALVQREPHRWIRSTTWSSSEAKTRILSPTLLTIEIIQKDMDQLLDDFITDYFQWNAKK